MKIYVKCTKSSGNLFSLGKIYEWIDGGLKCDDGYTFTTLCPSENPKNWTFPVYEFELLNPKKEIHITVDGNKTIAVLKEGGKVTKRAETKCNPEDKFDFATGARLAFDRLIGNGITFKFHGKAFAESIVKLHPIPPLNIKFPKAVKEVDRKAKEGEYIKIVKEGATFSTYKNGDIFKVYKLGASGVFCDMPKKTKQGINDNGNLIIYHREYVVLENYEPPKKEEKPVAIKIGDKVKIVDNGKSYTTYADWFDKHAPKYASRFAYGDTPENGTTGNVVAIAPHEYGGKTLYAISTGYFNAVYLVGEKGIERVGD